MKERGRGKEENECEQEESDERIEKVIGEVDERVRLVNRSGGEGRDCSKRKME